MATRSGPGAAAPARHRRGADSADPPVREIVTVGAVLETSDAVFGVDLTRVDLQAPTTLDHDLGLTHLAGNLLPAMQGVRAQEAFAVPDGVVVRTAANWTPTDPRPDYRYTLGAQQISWLPEGSTAYQPALSPPAGGRRWPRPAAARSPSGTVYAYRGHRGQHQRRNDGAGRRHGLVTGPHGSVGGDLEAGTGAVTYNVYGRTAGSPTKLAQAGPFAPGVTPTYVDTRCGPLPDPSRRRRSTRPPGPGRKQRRRWGPVSGGRRGSCDRRWPPPPVSRGAQRRWLLGSAPADAVFTLTPEHYSFVGGTGSTTWFDYDGEGTTIRFGDGTFGLTPADEIEFAVTYLAGGG